MYRASKNPSAPVRVHPKPGVRSTAPRRHPQGMATRDRATRVVKTRVRTMGSGMALSLRLALAPLIFLLFLVGPLAAQETERQVIFSQVVVTGQESSLNLEFADGQELSLSFRDGRILADGEELGTFSSGDPLHASWRSLLSEAIALEEAEVARLLREWAPPAELEGSAAEAGQALQSQLQAAFRGPVEDVPVFLDPGTDLQEALEALVLRTDRLRALTSAVRNLTTPELRVHVQEAVVVASDESVPGSLLLLNGSLQLDGQVAGDVILLGSSLEMGDDASIGGDLRWIETQVPEGARERVAGQVHEIQPVPDRPESDLREEIRREVRSALEATRAPSAPRAISFRTGRDAPGPLRNIGSGIVRIIQTAITYGIFLGIGLAVLYFFPRHFEIVGRTVRNAPGRSAVVGLATGVLAFPIWLTGVVILAITIIGIPLMLIWMPLFPLVLAAAVTLGFLAVARHSGSWVSHRGLAGMDSLNGSRPAIQLGVGLALLLGAFALAGVFQMGGAWFAIFKGLMAFLGVMVVLVAGTVGLGAVILSRGGRDPLYAGPDWHWGGDDPDDDPWAPEPDPFTPGPPPSEPAEAGGPTSPEGTRPGDGDGEATPEMAPDPEDRHEP